MSWGPKEGALASNVFKENSGAGLPTKGEGISFGSRFKPTAKNTSKPMKKARGIKNFFTLNSSNA
jgi:hypothetical protein